MAFQTPPPGGSRDQQHPISLLFSPSLKGTDGQKPPLGRTPSTAPGFAPARSFASREAATPPTRRRRSFTPASGGAAKDTPPPPPSGSLLDSPGGGGGGGAGPSLAGGWGLPGGAADAGGVEDMNTSPIGGGPAPAAPPQPPAPPSPRQQLQREYAAAGRALRDLDGTWVTVFGFAQADVPLVLREFCKCGDVEEFGTYGDGPHVNWMHLRYANRHAAQRALLRSGEQLSAACMVGVKPLDPGRREAMERAGGGGEGAARATPALPRAARARPYQLDAAAAQAAVVPLASKSAWEKVSEFILGL
jgi:hypothetical protein